MSARKGCAAWCSLCVSTDTVGEMIELAEGCEAIGCRSPRPTPSYLDTSEAVVTPLPANRGLSLREYLDRVEAVRAAGG